MNMEQVRATKPKEKDAASAGDIDKTTAGGREIEKYSKFESTREDDRASKTERKNAIGAVNNEKVISADKEIGQVAVADKSDAKKGGEQEEREIVLETRKTNSKTRDATLDVDAREEQSIEIIEKREHPTPVSVHVTVDDDDDDSEKQSKKDRGIKVSVNVHVKNHESGKRALDREIRDMQQKLPFQREQQQKGIVDLQRQQQEIRCVKDRQAEQQNQMVTLLRALCNE